MSANSSVINTLEDVIGVVTKFQDPEYGIYIRNCFRESTANKVDWLPNMIFYAGETGDVQALENTLKSVNLGFQKFSEIEQKYLEKFTLKDELKLTEKVTEFKKYITDSYTDRDNITRWFIGDEHTPGRLLDKILSEFPGLHILNLDRLERDTSKFACEEIVGKIAQHYLRALYRGKTAAEFTSALNKLMNL